MMICRQLVCLVAGLVLSGVSAAADFSFLGTFSRDDNVQVFSFSVGGHHGGRSERCGKSEDNRFQHCKIPLLFVRSFFEVCMARCREGRDLRGRGMDREISPPDRDGRTNAPGRDQKQILLCYMGIAGRYGLNQP